MEKQDKTFELPFEKVVSSSKETVNFAKLFATQIKKNDCLAFFGEMGAGKTTFIQGLAQGLGVCGEICSPTFSIVNEYCGEVPLIHFDMYRVMGEDDLATTNFFEYLNDPKNIIAIEWSENIVDFLPKDYIKIQIIKLNVRKRLIKISRG